MPIIRRPPKHTETVESKRVLDLLATIEDLEMEINKMEDKNAFYNDETIRRNKEFRAKIEAQDIEIKELKQKIKLLEDVNPQK
jgi:hypothetical protein